MIHVAGTNGKGSTIAFLRAALEAAGHGVHVYTSPHLVRFHERIRLAAPGGGRFVDEARLVDALERCERANAGEPITVFEITTAAAFLAVRREPGRRRCCSRSASAAGSTPPTSSSGRSSTVITSISLDHAEFLGDDDRRRSPPRRPASSSAACPSSSIRRATAVRAVVEATAARARAPLLIGGQDFDVHEENGRLVYQDETGLLDLPLPRLAGRHQHRNAGVAIATLHAQDRLTVTDKHIERAMQTVEWPARLQRLNRRPSRYRSCRAGAEIWLDGGHNVDGGRVLAEALAELEERSPRPLILVAGMLSTKDSDALPSQFCGARPRGARRADRRQSGDAAARGGRRGGASCRPARDGPCGSEEAFAAIAAASHPVPPRVVITGSLYLAGEVLALDGAALR